jgi:hypothetical protein
MTWMTPLEVCARTVGTVSSGQFNRVNSIHFSPRSEVLLGDLDLGTADGTAGVGSFTYIHLYAIQPFNPLNSIQSPP